MEQDFPRSRREKEEIPDIPKSRRWREETPDFPKSRRERRFIMRTTRCPDCDGSKRIKNKPCKRCDGTGRVRVKEYLF
jgi:hypothetical protein